MYQNKESTLVKNYSVFTEAWTSEPVIHAVSYKYPVKKYSVSIESWTAEQVFYPVSEQEECPAASEEYIRLTELKNYYISTEAWRAEPVFHEQKEYPVKNLSTEAWTTEQVFHPISEQEKCLVALEEYVGSTEPFKNYPVSTEGWTAELVLPAFTGWMVEPISPVSTEGWTAEPVFHSLSTDALTVDPVFPIFIEG